MPNSIRFTVNSKIEILMEDGIYKSNIQDVYDDHIGISIPVREGIYLPLKKGEKVEGIFYSYKGTFKFHTIVVGRKIDRIMMILLAKPKSFIKIQRRNYVRVSTVSKVICSIIDSSEDAQFFEGFTLDISAGGMKLSTSKELNIGDTIAISVTLKNEELHLKGKIIRVEKEDKRNICGVAFIDMDNKTTEKIVRLLFQIMREQRKNGPKED